MLAANYRALLHRVGRRLRARVPALPRAPLDACWDFPWPHPPAFGGLVTRDGKLTVAGWAVAIDGTPVIEVALDGRPVEQFHPSQYREDLEKVLWHAYPAVSGKAGWVRAVDVSGLPAGAHQVSVIVRCGSHVVPLGTRTFECGPPTDLDAFWADLRPLLRIPAAQATLVRGHHIFFDSEPGLWLSQPTSVWGFSGFAQEVMRQREARVLVIGAGIGLTVPNAIQLDVADYPNIDVIAGSPELPFVDAAFDAVLCENVIEHVPNPFTLVGEIIRVLKPGGRLGLNGTNMHFTHGFPSHYFNPTEFGMRHLLDAHFSGDYAFIDAPRSLRMILEHVLTCLPPAERKEVERLTVADLMADAPSLAATEVGRLMAYLPVPVQRAISTNIYFSGTKKRD